VKKSVLSAVLIAALAALMAPPVYGVSRETIQMMQQLDTLLQMVQNLQKTVDSQTAVLRTLIEQNSNAISQMRQQMGGVQKATQNLATSSTKLDSITSEIQALSASIAETNSRLAKLSEQVAQTQNIIQTLNQPPTPASGTAAAGGAQGPAGQASQTGDTQSSQPQVPDPASLFSSALSSYNGGQYKLAVQGFQEYLQYYANTDRASDAQFYIGDSYYNMGNYPKAIDQFNVCLERYQSGSRLPTAQLKKAYSLLALGETRAGVRELQSLIKRYPHSSEADLARQRLKGIESASRSRR
jgi:tol-pal system protein YbgF